MMPSDRCALWWKRVSKPGNETYRAATARERVPTSIPGILRALRFDAPDMSLPRSIPESQWGDLFRATDRAQLTLALGVRARACMPPAALARVDQCLIDNADRYETILVRYGEMAAGLQAAGVDFVVLKGLAQWPWYSDDPRHRPQNDIDLWCPTQSLAAARRVLEGLGYSAVGEDLSRGTDHLPIMIRKTGWTWRGNYYDPDMPPSAEIHFRLWNADLEGFEIEGLEGFWNRRVVREIGGLKIPTLHPADGLTYSAMHAVRHLLRGDLQPRHIYELAHFLHKSADEDGFWQFWAGFRAPQRRLVEGIAFRFAAEWFGPDMHPVAREAVGSLPAPVARWFDLFAMSPAVSLTHPNKDELWLHRLLVEGADARRSVTIRRLFPTRGTRVVLDAHVDSRAAGIVLRARRALFEFRFLARRALYHLRALIPLARSGIRWWRCRLTAIP
jgi:hypothetical protein